VRIFENRKLFEIVTIEEEDSDNIEDEEFGSSSGNAGHSRL